ISEVLDRHTHCNAAEEGVSDDLKMKCELASSSVQKSTELAQTVHRLDFCVYSILLGSNDNSSLVFYQTRCLESPNSEELSVDDLLQLEKQLNTALLHTRATKTQLLVNSKMNLKEQVKVLLDENEDLARKVAELQGNSDN
ncbi:hypothetical protein Droror1_Dr00018720, partial [Drosera rotundifolia]